MFRGNDKFSRGLVGDILGGNIEILHMKGALVADVYHFWQPEPLPVTMPLGFISTDTTTVEILGRIVRDYVDGHSSFDKPNDCGAIASNAQHR